MVGTSLRPAAGLRLAPGRIFFYYVLELIGILLHLYVS